MEIYLSVGIIEGTNGAKSIVDIKSEYKDTAVTVLYSQDSMVICTDDVIEAFYMSNKHLIDELNVRHYRLTTDSYIAYDDIVKAFTSNYNNLVKAGEISMEVYKVFEEFYERGL